MLCWARWLLRSSSWWARSTIRRRSGTSATGRSGATPRDEAELGGIHVADAGEPRLVEQGLLDRAVGLLPESAYGLVGVPVGAEQVGAEVTDQVGLAVTGHDLDEAESETHRDGVVGRQDHASGVGRPGPARPWPEHPPAALHLEVGVEGPTGVAVDPREQVLATRGGLADRGAGEVPGGERRHPEVGRGQHRAGERAVEEARRPPDGVTLRHAASAPAASRGTRRRRAPRAAGWSRRRGSARRRPSRPSAGPGHRGDRPRRATARPDRGGWRRRTRSAASCRRVRRRG